VTVREIKLRPKIATNDYETKKNHVERFLKHQDRVKITIMFRGRETTHPERGERLLMQLAEDVSEWGTIEQRPNLDGRNMTMLLAPVRQKEAAAGGDGDAPVGDEQAAPPPAAPAATAAEQAAAPEAAPPEAPEAAAPDAPEAEAPDAPEAEAPDAPEAEAPPAAAADDAASA
jgi:translation initiation factor IF-3